MSGQERENTKVVKLFHPSIVIRKNDVPPIFLDTFMWSKLIKEYDVERTMLERCVKNKKIVIIMTNLLEGELQQHNLLYEVEKISNNNYINIPVGYISANQAIASMIAYYNDIKNVKLSWQSAISEVPILTPIKINLKDIVSQLASEMNKIRKEFRGKKESFISNLVHVEIEKWIQELRPYWNLISVDNKPEKTYIEFFYSDYFLDLPAIMIGPYLFAYILNEREISVQDVVDVYHISEVVPYTYLSILDKDQYNRCLQLKRDYPEVFTSLFKYTNISSFHMDSPDPVMSLRWFLEWCHTKIVDNEYCEPKNF